MPRHLKLHDLFPGEEHKATDPVTGRRLVLGNADVRISYAVSSADLARTTATPPATSASTSSAARATVETTFGALEVGQGDYVILPRATTHRWVPTGDEPLRTYAIEANSHIAPPKRYLSRYGQFLEHAPYCERDLRAPAEPLLAEGTDVEVYVKHRGDGPGGLAGTIHVVPEHPFDVVGWDGCLYPYAFNVADYEPITGRVHQPPPVHQVFEGHNFVICNFVPRKVDYHPLAVPVPYYHSNVDSDEVMFYVDGDYEARKGSGIGKGSISPAPRRAQPRPAARRGRALPRRRVLRRARRHGRHLPPARPRRGRHRRRRRQVRLVLVGPGTVGVTALFDGLFDDAALFPPGNAPMAAAVPAHRELRAPLGGLVGPFVVPAARLDELTAHLGAGLGVRRLADRGGRRPAGRRAPVEDDPRLALAAVEVPVVADAAAAAEAVRALDESCPPTVPAAVELPRTTGPGRGARCPRRHPLPGQAAHRRRPGRAVPVRGGAGRDARRPASPRGVRSSAPPGCTTPSGTPTRRPASSTTASSTCCSRSRP